MKTMSIAVKRAEVKKLVEECDQLYEAAKAANPSLRCYVYDESVVWWNIIAWCGLALSMLGFAIGNVFVFVGFLIVAIVATIMFITDGEEENIVTADRDSIKRLQDGITRYRNTIERFAQQKAKYGPWIEKFYQLKPVVCTEMGGYIDSIEQCDNFHVFISIDAWAHVVDVEPTKSNYDQVVIKLINQRRKDGTTIRDQIVADFERDLATNCTPA